MDDMRTVLWTGMSGQRYEFDVMGLPAPLEGGQKGLYVFVRFNQGSCIPVFFGCGDLSILRDLDGHERANSLRSKGVTHVHVRVETNGADCEAEVADLLAAYPMAYEPFGCNVKATSEAGLRLEA